MKFEYPGERKKVPEAGPHAEFYPGRSSAAGFLAPGEDLDAVIAADRAACERRNVTPEEVGKAIEELLQGARKDEFEVSTTAWRGMQACPFDQEMHPFSNVDFTITNKRSGASFSGPGLIAHLLKSHGFFEGNTPYRVDPDQAIDVLFGEPVLEKGEL